MSDTTALDDLLADFRARYRAITGIDQPTHLDIAPATMSATSQDGTVTVCFHAKDGTTATIRTGEAGAALIVSAVADALRKSMTDDRPDPNRPLSLYEFVAAKVPGVKATDLAVRLFGRCVSDTYLAEHGQRPPKSEITGNRLYTEADRPLLEKAWARFDGEEAAR